MANSAAAAWADVGNIALGWRLENSMYVVCSIAAPKNSVTFPAAFFSVCWPLSDHNNNTETAAAAASTNN